MTEIGTGRYHAMTTAALLGALAEAVESDATSEVVVTAVELGRRLERGELTEDATVAERVDALSASQARGHVAIHARIDELADEIARRGSEDDR